MIRLSRLFAILAIVVGLHAYLPATSPAQAVRSKKPDRGVYRSPSRQRHVEVSTGRRSLEKPSTVGLVSVDLDAVETEAEATLKEGQAPTVVRPRLRRIQEEQVDLQPPPASDFDAPPPVDDVRNDQPVEQVQYGVITQEIWGEANCGCETPGCDGVMCGWEPGCGLEGYCDEGCDSLACDNCQTQASICFAPHRWFGSLDLMSMFRKGDRLPALVTTGPSTDSATAGRLDQASTQILVGNGTEFENGTVGGRLMIGTWLDDAQQRSIQLRGWAAGEESFEFFADESDFEVLARPFFDVSDGITPADEIQLVAFPNRTFGSIRVRGESNVAGGDISFHQPWVRGPYGAVDVLYGYQYMRLDESLTIRSVATSLDDDFAPVGSVIDISDSFDAENDFHGGQLGLSTHYREGCWTIRALAKVGFGALRRSANRRGTTITSVDAATAVDNQGLFVRDLNSGRLSDNTFGWTPELDVSLGWHRFPRFDVKVGYHLVAMTDALQVSGALDPNLAVNLSDPPTGSQNPSAGLRFDTFYVHGIHLGLHYAY